MKHHPVRPCGKHIATSDCHQRELQICSFCSDNLCLLKLEQELRAFILKINTSDAQLTSIPPGASCMECTFKQKLLTRIVIITTDSQY